MDQGLIMAHLFQFFAQSKRIRLLIVRKSRVEIPITLTNSKTKSEEDKNDDGGRYVQNLDSIKH